MPTTFHTERLDFCPACGGPWRNGQGEVAIVCANCGQPPTVKIAPSANDMQVGGTHYGGEYQHWDLVADLGMGPRQRRKVVMVKLTEEQEKGNPLRVTVGGKVVEDQAAGIAAFKAVCETKSANDMQVGGTHYGGEYQHWDLVADLGMNYYQGNASKYITRAYKKNGRQDLEKAVHYMQKAIELQRQGRLDEPDDDADFDIILRFMTANDLTPGQGKIIWKIYHGEWYSAIDLTRALIAKVTDEVTPPVVVK